LYSMHASPHIGDEQVTITCVICMLARIGWWFLVCV